MQVQIFINTTRTQVVGHLWSFVRTDLEIGISGLLLVLVLSTMVLALSFQAKAELTFLFSTLVDEILPLTSCPSLGEK